MSRDVINKWVMINQKFEKIFKGSNPEVFKYSFLQHTTSGNKILAMKFYEWLEIWIVPIKDSFEPSLNL